MSSSWHRRSYAAGPPAVPSSKRRPRSSSGKFREFGLKPADGKNYYQAFPVTTSAKLGPGQPAHRQRERPDRHAPVPEATYVPFNFSHSGTLSRRGGLRRLRHHRPRIPLRRLCRHRRKGQDCHDLTPRTSRIGRAQRLCRKGVHPARPVHQQGEQCQDARRGRRHPGQRCRPTTRRGGQAGEVRRRRRSRRTPGFHSSR